MSGAPYDAVLVLSFGGPEKPDDVIPEMRGALARLTLDGRPVAVQWLALLLLSAGLTLALEAGRLPAGFMLGPLVAGILVAALGGSPRVPRLPFYMAQGVIGCMIARNITPSILGEMLRDWPIFLAAVLSVVIVSNLLGWLLARRQILPGTTAV